MIFLPATDPELIRVWGTFDDPKELNHGEVWQYMGTVHRPLDPSGPRYVHQFRHRCHPVTNTRKYANIFAPPHWQPPKPRYITLEDNL